MTNTMNIFGSDTNEARIANALLENGVFSEDDIEDVDDLLAQVSENFKSFEAWSKEGFSVKKGEHRLARCRLWVPTDEIITNKDGKESKKFVQRWANIYAKEQTMPTEEAKALYKKMKEEARHAKEEAQKTEVKAEEPKAEKVEKAIKETAKPKVAKATTKKTKKNGSKKTAVQTVAKKTEKAEKKVAKVSSKKATRKAEKVEKPKTEMKHNPVQFNKVTKNGQMYLQILNYKDGKEVGSAYIPFYHFSKASEETKVALVKMLGIA